MPYRIRPAHITAAHCTAQHWHTVYSSSSHGQPARPFGIPQPESALRSMACSVQRAACNVPCESPGRCCWLRSTLACDAQTSIEPARSQGRRLIEPPVLSCHVRRYKQMAARDSSAGGLVIPPLASLCPAGLPARHRLSRGQDHTAQPRTAAYSFQTCHRAGRWRLTARKGWIMAIPSLTSLQPNSQDNRWSTRQGRVPIGVANQQWRISDARKTPEKGRGAGPLGRECPGH